MKNEDWLIVNNRYISCVHVSHILLSQREKTLFGVNAMMIQCSFCFKLTDLSLSIMEANSSSSNHACALMNLNENEDSQKRGFFESGGF